MPVNISAIETESIESKRLNKNDLPKKTNTTDGIVAKMIKKI